MTFPQLIIVVIHSNNSKTRMFSILYLVFFSYRASLKRYYVWCGQEQQDEQQVYCQVELVFGPLETFY